MIFDVNFGAGEPETGFEGRKFATFLGTTTAKGQPAALTAREIKLALEVPGAAVRIMRGQFLRVVKSVTEKQG